ncbi:MAG: SdpI family protein [Anaerolineae bacterium]
MSVLMGLGFGAVLLVVGLLTAIFAPQVGPNPFFGFRIGDAFSSREAWDRTNRAGGIAFALVGAATLILALVIAQLNLPRDVGLIALTFFTVVALGGATIWAILYARQFAPPAPPATPTGETGTAGFGWPYLLPILLTLALLAASSLYFYPQLPLARMASHFNIHDQPDGWTTRDAFMQTFQGLAVTMLVVNTVLILIAAFSRRKPRVPLGWPWNKLPTRGLFYVGIALSLLNSMITIIQLNVLWFNTRGVLLFPFGNMFLFAAPLLLALVLLYWLIAALYEPAA